MRRDRDDENSKAGALLLLYECLLLKINVLLKEGTRCTTGPILKKYCVIKRYTAAATAVQDAW